jgi:hypothetical protein
MPATSKPKTVSTRQAATALGVSGYTIRQWIRLGVLRAVKATDSPHRQNRWRVTASSLTRVRRARRGIKRS